MASQVHRALKECADHQDNLGPRVPRGGQVAKDLKDQLERKAVGEKKELVESLDPRGKLDFRVNLERMD